MSLAFPKKCRLLLPKDFNKLKLSSKKKRSGNLIVYYRQRTDNEKAKMAISVSAKFYNSVQRNKLKRIIREGFRTGYLRNYPIDILFVVVGQVSSDNFKLLVTGVNKSFLSVTTELEKSIKNNTAM